MAKPVPIGTRAAVENRVEFKNTLTAWREELPPVLSTPNMIGWMEAAGFELLLPFCEGDEVSVGTAINIIHRAATGIGATVKCEAVLEEFNGRFYTFRVTLVTGRRCWDTVPLSAPSSARVSSRRSSGRNSRQKVLEHGKGLTIGFTSRRKAC